MKQPLVRGQPVAVVAVAAACRETCCTRTADESKRGRRKSAATAVIACSVISILMALLTTRATAEPMRATPDGMRQEETVESPFETLAPSQRSRAALVAAQGVPDARLSPATLSGVTWNRGDLFVGVAGGNYEIFDDNGNSKDAISSGLSTDTSGCAFNRPLSELFTTQFQGDFVLGFDDDAPHDVLTAIPSTNGNRHPESIVFDSDGNFYVGHADGAKQLEKYDPSGNLLVRFNPATGPRGTDWIDLAADQKTIFYTSEGSIVRRFDVSTNSQLPDFSHAGGVMYALRLLPPFDGSGGLLVANSLNILRLDGVGNIAQTYSAPGESAWFALTLDRNGTSFWAGDGVTHHFYRFDIATGTKEVGPIAGPGGISGLCVKQEVDSDKDGIPDDWELYGITVDAAGSVSVGDTGNGIFVDLPSMGADPMHKDLFVHVDWMDPDPSTPGSDFTPNARAIEMVTDAFANAPVENPDNTPGINLHVDFGPNSIMNPVTGETWGALSSAGNVPFQEFLVPLGQLFSDALNQNKAYHFLPAGRSPIFHYALYCKNIDTVGPAGLGEVLSTGLAIRARVAKPVREAGSFMHELGHNLNLQHGGGDLVNRKPNYVSIMNYNFQVLGALQSNGTQRDIDYSRQPLDPLDENNNLDESHGINDPMGHLTFWNIWTRDDIPPGSNKCVQDPDSYNRLFSPSSALDWNCNGQLDAGLVTAEVHTDLRCLIPGPDSGGTLHAAPAGDDVLVTETATLLGVRQTLYAGPNRTCDTTAACDPADPSNFRKCDIQLPTNPVGQVIPVDLRVLNGFDDWANLVFDAGGKIGNRTGNAVPAQLLANSGTSASTPPQTSTPGIPATEESVDELEAEAPLALLAEEDAAPLDVVTFAPQAGVAPLTVNFDGSASTAVTGATIVGWSWDFGDGASGSGALVTHTYTATGDYFARLTVTDSNGHVNLVPLRQRVTVVDGRPNLTPYQPPGWSDKIVVSNVPGTHTDSGGLKSTDTLYVDWAVINNGNIPTAAAFSVALYVDGVEIQTFAVNPPLGVGSYSSVEDYSLGVLAPGSHTIQIVADSTGAIDETNELDNAYSKVVNITLSNPTPGPPGPGAVDSIFKSTASENGGIVYAAVVQPDGKIVIGGHFKAFAGCASLNIARINPDGTCDPTFDPELALRDPSGASVTVWTLALQADGKILVGLQSPTPGLPNGIYRLNTDGTDDTTFNAAGLNLGVSGGVFAIAIQPDDKVIVGGDFLAAGQSGITRLNANGSIDLSFLLSSAPSGLVYAVLLQPDGKIVFGTSSLSNNVLVRLNASGSTDASFQAPICAGTVSGLALQSDGKIIATGGITKNGSCDTTVTDSVARFNSDGTPDGGFTDPFPPIGLSAVMDSNPVIQPDGAIVLGGNLLATGNNVARLNSDGTLDNSFNTGTGITGQVASVYAVALTGTGQILFAGQFNNFNSTPVESIVQVNSDGSRDASFASNGPGGNAEVVALLQQPDGKWLVGVNPPTSTLDETTKLNGVTSIPIGRLNADGSADTTFSSPLKTGSTIFALAQQTDGKVIISGNLTLDPRSGFFNLARLNEDGTLDTTFTPPSYAGGGPIAIQGDGKIIAATLGGSTSNIVRLNANGSLDGSFSTSFCCNQTALLMILQPDGRVLIGGFFTGIDGATRNNLARLNSNGSLDATFDPGAGPSGGNGFPVRTMALQSDGKILIGGFFYDYAGTPCPAIARLNSNGSLDSSFVPDNPNTAKNYPAQAVGALALQADGKIVVGPDREDIPTSPFSIFRLNPDGSLDQTFALRSGIESAASNRIDAIGFQADGEILVGGAFDVINGYARLALARLDNSVSGSSPSPTATPTQLPTLIPTPTATLTLTSTPTMTITAAAGASATPTRTVTHTGSPAPTVTPSPTAGTCYLDVDGSGRPPDVATDMVYIARRLLGLPTVPSSFRLLALGIPSDFAINSHIDAIGGGLDVDLDGRIDVATDLVYIARRLLGLPTVPASFRALNASLPSDNAIDARIDALCP